MCTIRQENPCKLSFDMCQTLMLFVLFCSVIGAVLIMAGLYLVVWGKSEESKFAEEKAAIPSVDHENNNQRKSTSKSSLVQPLIRAQSENVDKIFS